MMEAKIQWTELPKDWPFALRWLGKISAINTHITVPCPIACAAIKTNKNKGIKNPFQFNKKKSPTMDKEIIYPTDPILISVLRPVLSIKYMPSIVKIRLTKPTPILLKKAESDLRPAASNILGA